MEKRGFAEGRIKFILFPLFLLFFVYLNWDNYKARKLYDAASRADKKSVEELISEGVELDKALIFALNTVDRPAVKILVEHGANIKEIGNEYLVRSLFKAKTNHFRGDYIALTQLMIDYKIDLSKPSGYFGHTPLMGAVFRKNDEIINTLLNLPVNVNAMNEHCETVLFRVETLKTAKLLLSRGANINQENCHYATPLVGACKKENLELVEFFISKGAKIDAYEIDTGEQTDCLLYGIENKNKALIDLVLKSGANINYSKANRKSPLTFAINMESIDMVGYLISKGADVNSKDKNGNLPLILAVAKEDISLVEFLLVNKANVNQKDKFGNTALELAEISKNEKLIQILKNANQSH